MKISDCKDCGMPCRSRHGYCLKCGPTGRLQKRFWEKVDKNGPFILKSACWVWTGARHQGRYGHLWVKGRMVGAHRVSYEINVGQIPNGKLLMHRCDNMACVRPDHLEIGTNHTNRQDSLKKGRLAWAKLKPDHVREIKRRYVRGDGENTRRLAKQFGVHPTTIHCVMRGLTWKDV